MSSRPQLKQCSICSIFKSFSEFHRQADGAGGYRASCKVCRKAIRRNEYLANIIVVSAQTAAYQSAHRPAYNAYADKWRKANPAKENARKRRYDALKKQRMPLWLTYIDKKEIANWYQLAQELQWLSDPTDQLTVDHIIPLKGKNVSGLHVPWNLQILPRSVNSSKGNRI